jgi:hypothetical protein
MFVKDVENQKQKKGTSHDTKYAQNGFLSMGF